jgi:cytochrome P450
MSFFVAEKMSDPGVMADPYPFYAWLRENEPIHLDPDGAAYISRYDLAMVLKDPDLRDTPRRDLEAADSYAIATMNRALIKEVAPRHARLRRQATATVFSPSQLERLEVVGLAVVEELLDAFEGELRDGYPVDLHVRYTKPAVEQMAAEYFGIPHKHREELLPLPGLVFRTMYPRRTEEDVRNADVAARAMIDYLRDVIPRNGFLPGSALHALVRDGDLTGDDLLYTCYTMLQGSHLSPMAALDLAVTTAMDHPEHHGVLFTEPRAWLEEATRFRSPLITTGANLAPRVTLRAGGVELAAHTPVRIMVGAANRDPGAFGEPDRFTPHRPRSRPHLAFGTGPHTCIARHMAHVQTKIALQGLVRRFGTGLRPAGPVVWSSYRSQRAMKSFPVALGA